MTFAMEQTYGELRVAPPIPTGESRHFWESARESRLVLQHCAACGTFQSYPRRRCSRCWSGQLDWVDSSGFGHVVTHTAVHRPGQTSWQPVVPYYVGLVRLDENAVLLSHFLTEEGAPTVGSRCVVQFVQVGEWRLPFFRTILP